jgi:hypothetical protein
MLKVRVYDKDLLTSDDDLGVAMRGLADLEHGHVRRLQLPLRGPSVSGCVDLSLVFLSFSGEFTQAALPSRCSGILVGSPHSSARMVSSSANHVSFVLHVFAVLLRMQQLAARSWLVAPCFQLPPRAPC